MPRMVLCMLLLLGAVQPAAAADPERGGKLFGQTCTACHSREQGKHRTGPSLAGLWGRKAGSLKSFPRYSPALKAADVVWNEATLEAWITNPEAFIPGNFMGFPGIEDDADRADLIAFLKDASDPGLTPD